MLLHTGCVVLGVQRNHIEVTVDHQLQWKLASSQISCYPSPPSPSPIYVHNSLLLHTLPCPHLHTLTSYAISVPSPLPPPPLPQLGVVDLSQYLRDGNYLARPTDESEPESSAEPDKVDTTSLARLMDQKAFLEERNRKLE